MIVPLVKLDNRLLFDQVARAMDDDEGLSKERSEQLGLYASLNGKSIGEEEYVVPQKTTSVKAKMFQASGCFRKTVTSAPPLVESLVVHQGNEE